MSLACPLCGDEQAAPACAYCGYDFDRAHALPAIPRLQERVRAATNLAFLGLCSLVFAMLTFLFSGPGASLAFVGLSVVGPIMIGFGANRANRANRALDAAKKQLPELPAARIVDK